MKNGLTLGLIAGLLYMGWIIIAGNTFPTLVYGSWQALLISSILIIGFMLLACQKEKAVLGGSIHFGEAFLVCLMTYLAFNLVYGIGFKFYLESSPTAMAAFLEVTKQSTSEIMAMANAGEDEIFEAIESLNETLPNMFSWKATLMTIVGGLIFPGAVLALITAAITSKFPKKTTV